MKLENETLEYYCSVHLSWADWNPVILGLPSMFEVW